MFDKYLESYHRETIFQILEDADESKHFSININFIELFGNYPNLGTTLLKEPEKTLEDWDIALRKVQTKFLLQSETNLILKKHVHCRIFGLPMCPDLHRTIFPRNEDANKFLQVSGTVVRITAMKILEFQRQYICTKCKYTMIVNAEYDRKNIIVSPKKCGNPEECKGTNLINMGELNPEFCKDYQEIKIQEIVSKLGVGHIPSSMWVTLEDNLVDSCKPGDNITVCGVVKTRWNQFYPGKKIEIDLVIRANHILVNNNSTPTSITPELKEMFQAFWKTYSDNPLAARDIILKSICPQLFGLYIVKLAIAVVLAGGSYHNDDSSTGVRVRSEPHLLLVGDPGTGKSQLLRFASKIIPRSVLTTGVGSTAAGLTVTAVMENGEWQLEGGALVLADGGICCIDEFNSMKEHDRTSIHEAMEQQSISVAKASIVCKLSTKCSILAATNPKGNLDSSQPLSMNIALATPLLSRFDLILLLRDKVDENWDNLIADYILNEQDTISKLSEDINWTVETLQAYFAIIKKNHPILTEDSNKILSSYYQAQRRKNCRNKSRTTVRLLDSLVRLSQGHARLMYHQEVQIVDAVIAVVLVETAMEADSSVFNLHFDVQSDFPSNPTTNYQELVKIVLNKLHLQDLLDKENELLSKKTLPNNRIQNINNNEDKENIDIGIESRFFQTKEDTEDTKSKDSNNDEFNNRPINIQKIKRTKSANSNIKSKKIKLSDNENHVKKDLAALDCMPSVNDFPLLNDFEDDKNICLELEINTKKLYIQDEQITSESDINEPSTFKTISETEEKESNNKTNIFNITEENKTWKESAETSEDNIQIKPPPKCRKVLDKFRFISKDNSVAPTVTVTEEKHKETTPEKKDTKLKINETNNPNIFENTLAPEDIFKDLEEVAQSTQQPKKKFQFKKKVVSEAKSVIQKSTLQRHDSVFESQEDLDNLDLDL